MLKKCLDCAVLSPKVYQAEWVCLNPDCSLFWTVSNGCMHLLSTDRFVQLSSNEPVPQSELKFDQSFLALRKLPEQLRRIPYSIIPEYPSWQCQMNGESIFNRHFWAGACCPRCGRVSCRYVWVFMTLCIFLKLTGHRQKWIVWECPTCKVRTHRRGRPNYSKPFFAQS
jgi:hypothetical protein